MGGGRRYLGSASPRLMARVSRVARVKKRRRARGALSKREAQISHSSSKPSGGLEAPGEERRDETNHPGCSWEAPVSIDIDAEERLTTAAGVCCALDSAIETLGSNLSMESIAQVRRCAAHASSLLLSTEARRSDIQAVLAAVVRLTASKLRMAPKVDGSTTRSLIRHICEEANLQLADQRQDATGYRLGKLSVCYDSDSRCFVLMNRDTGCLEAHWPFDFSSLACA